MQGALFGCYQEFSSDARHGHGVIRGVRFIGGSRVLGGGTRVATRVEGLTPSRLYGVDIISGSFTQYQDLLVRGRFGGYALTYTQYASGGCGLTLVGARHGAMRDVDTVEMYFERVCGVGRGIAFIL